MPIISKHLPGAFCWTDLVTTDPAGAKRFYSELFGWEVQDLPAPVGGSYAMARLAGQYVAAIIEMSQGQRDQHVPPNWNSYFAVEDAERTAEKIAQLGGTVLEPPFDVGDAGRLSAAKDPSGAFFALWQPKQHIGAGLFGEPGAPIWTELQTHDLDACRSFYTKLFGWNLQAMSTAHGGYFVCRVGEQGVAGMMAMPKDVPPGTPPSWTVYFGVKDCDATFKKAQSMGSRSCVPPTDIPDVGRFSMLFDPQGAIFATLQPAPM